MVSPIGDTIRDRLLAIDGQRGFLHVRPSEEVSKEHEIGRVHDEGDLDILIGDVAFVSGLLHLVGPDVNGSTHDHLCELCGGNEHGYVPGHSEFEGLEGVVTVHDTVHQVVHAHEPAGGGDVVGVGVPGVEEYGHVMVPMEEDEGLFAEYDEHSVTQFRHLAQGEHPVPEASHTVVQETATKETR